MIAYLSLTRVRSTATFRLPNGVVEDPTEVSCLITRPNSTESEIAHVRASPGVYYADISTESKGIWKIRWIGTGSDEAVGADKFRIN